MKIQKGLLALCMLSLSFLTTGAFAKEDKATRQAEVQQKTRRRWSASTRPSRS